MVLGETPVAFASSPISMAGRLLRQDAICRLDHCQKQLTTAGATKFGAIFPNEVSMATTISVGAALAAKKGRP
jgi:hypothetical protein